MKKRMFCASVLALAIVFALCACGNNNIAVELVEETAWSVYPIENAPVKITEAGGVWYAILGRYGSDDFTFAVGESSDTLGKRGYNLMFVVDMKSRHRFADAVMS